MDKVTSTNEVLAVGAEGRGSGAGSVYLYSCLLLRCRTLYIKRRGTATNSRSTSLPVMLSVVVSLCLVITHSIAIGATEEDSSGNNAGAVYLFESESATSLAWSCGAKLVASNGEASDYFGSSLGIMKYTQESFGRDVAVGAYAHDSNRGAVYVFHEYIQTEGLVGSLHTWSQSSILRPYSNGNLGDNFGYNSVSVFRRRQ